MIWTKISDTAITNGTYVIAKFLMKGRPRFLLSENGRRGKELGWFDESREAKNKAEQLIKERPSA